MVRDVLVWSSSVPTYPAAVANRTDGIGTLRAPGFQWGRIVAAFPGKSLRIDFPGGCVGLFFAFFLQLFTIFTLTFQAFFGVGLLLYLHP